MAAMGASRSKSRLGSFYSTLAREWKKENGGANSTSKEDHRDRECPAERV